MAGTNIIPRDEDKPHLVKANAFYIQVQAELANNYPNRRTFADFLAKKQTELIHDARLDVSDGNGRLAELKLQVIEKTLRVVLDWYTQHKDDRFLAAASLEGVGARVKDVFEKRERLAKRYGQTVYPMIPAPEPAQKDLFPDTLGVPPVLQPTRPKQKPSLKNTDPKPKPGSDT